MLNRKRIHELEQQVIQLKKKLEQEQNRGEVFYSVAKDFDITPLLPRIHEEVIKNLGKFIEQDFINVLHQATNALQRERYPSLTAFAALPEQVKLSRFPVYMIEVRMSSGGGRFRIGGL